MLWMAAVPRPNTLKGRARHRLQASPVVVLFSVWARRLFHLNRNEVVVWRGLLTAAMHDQVRRNLDNLFTVIDDCLHLAMLLTIVFNICVVTSQSVYESPRVLRRLQPLR